MKEPLLADERFLADVCDTKKKAGMLDLWWLGQSGFLLHHREEWILIDPYLSDSLTTKYAATDKPHIRISRRVVDPVALGARLESVHMLTVSHAHTDHLDPDTLRPILSACRVRTIIAPQPVIPLAFERAATLSGHAPRYVGLDDDEVFEEGIKVTGIAAAHEMIERDQSGHCKYLGYVFSLSAIPAPDDTQDSQPMKKEWTVYHSGDTVLYDGLAERLRPFKIDVAILPINGRWPERRVAGNLSGREAAQLAKAIGARVVIPCHFDMFEFNTASPADEFVPECKRIGQPYRILQQGERLSCAEIKL